MMTTKQACFLSLIFLFVHTALGFRTPPDEPPFADFIETFALAEDREAVLKELVPGTDAYYFFHCLHAQNTGDVKTYTTMRDQWIARRNDGGPEPADLDALLQDLVPVPSPPSSLDDLFGSPVASPIPSRSNAGDDLFASGGFEDVDDLFGNPSPHLVHLRRLERRQRILDYEADPVANLKPLADMLGVRLDHPQPKLAGDKQPPPNELDPKLLSETEWMKRALAEVNPGVTEAGLHLIDGIDSQKLSSGKRFQLLKRFTWPDHPALLDLVEADLRRAKSPGFGSIPIHERLTLQQFQELLARRPALKTELSFVLAYLKKLAPSEDVVLEREPVERTAYFQRLYTFASGLHPTYNSIKAAILYHWLDHDRGLGNYDMDRFFAYVKLPRNCSYVPPMFLRDAQYRVNLGKNCGVYELPTIRNDRELVMDYLDREFRTAADFDKYRPYIQESVLKDAFASAKITQGAAGADLERWVSMLPPSRYQELKESVELAFTPDSPTHFANDQLISLKLAVKNVPEVLVHIYRLNTFHVLAETGEGIPLDLNLEGLVPTAEKRVAFDLPPERRQVHRFTFPECEGRGTWMIELIGNGTSSRALVTRGHLEAREQITVAGHAFTLLDEQLKPLPEAVLWLGGREYTANTNGVILVPFSTNPDDVKAVLREHADSDFASLFPFEHLGETYRLEAGVHVEREALLADAETVVVIRPRLSIHNQAASLDLLETSTLDIHFTGPNGVNASSTHVLEGDLKLADDADTAVPFRVPAGARNLRVVLNSSVRSLVTGKIINLRSTAGSVRDERASRRGPEQDDAGILDLMEQILIPEFSFKGASLYDVVEFMIAASREGDPRAARSGDYDGATGVNIIMDLDGWRGRRTPTVTINLRRVNLKDALDFVCEVTNLEYSIKKGVVIIHPPGNGPRGATGSAPVPLLKLISIPSIHNEHLVATLDGLECHVLGLNGEPVAGHALRCEFYHWAFTKPVEVQLQTDARGVVRFGRLPTIRHVVINGREHIPPSHQAMIAANVHALAGQAVQVPLTAPGKLAGRPAPSLFAFNQAGALVADVSRRLTVKDGLLNIAGLPAGDYKGRVPFQRLLVSRQSNRYLQPSNPRPLQIASVEADGDQLRVRLQNPGEQTRVHVFASHFVPDVPAVGLQVSQAPLYSRDRYWSQTLSQSNRQLGDEVRYVFERQAAAKFPGVMAERPTLLLNPWDRKETLRSEERLKRSGRIDRRRPDAAPRGDTGSGDRGGSTHTPLLDGGFDHHLDFLAGPSRVALNLRPGADGVVTLPLADLGKKHHLQVVAIDGEQTVGAHHLLPPQPQKTRDRRMDAPTDPVQTLVQRSLTTELVTGKPVQIANAATARFAAFTTIADAWDVMQTLSDDQTLRNFAWLKHWDKLPEAERLTRYSEYACHELHLFLHVKDRAFFDRVIRPYLANKRDKTFVDHYLLENDLSGYLRPYAFGNLNTVEKILLGRRLDGQRESIARWMSDKVARQVPNPKSARLRFMAAIGRDDVIVTRAMVTNVRDLKFEPRPQGPARQDEFQNAPVDYAEKLAEQEEQIERLQADLDEVNAEAFDLTRQLEICRRGSGGGIVQSDPFGGEYDSGSDGFDGGGFGFGAPPPPGGDDFFGGLDGGFDGPMPVPSPESTRELEGRSADLNFGGSRGLREQGRSAGLYREQDLTREWAENNYYQLRIEEQNGSLIPVRAYWAALAAHDGKGPFLSPEFTQATSCFAEIMLALTFLDLPLSGDAPKQESMGDVLTLTPSQPGLLFHQELRDTRFDAEPGAGSADSLLLAVDVFRADDRYENVNGQKVERLVKPPLLPQVIYGTRVILTNPRSTPRTVDLLLQVPKGAMPVGDFQEAHGETVELGGYASHSVETLFVFPTVPESGEAVFYPVTLSENEVLRLESGARRLPVVLVSPEVDKTAWAHVAAQGSADDALTALRERNLDGLALNKIAWRMKDRGFYDEAIRVLRGRHVFDLELWAYSFLHQDRETIREYVEVAPVADKLGPFFASDLLNVDPVERRFTEHLEFAPLINPRIHPVGGESQILNKDQKSQFRWMLWTLAHKPTLDAENQLAVLYHLLLQDRFVEAIARRKTLPVDKLPEKLQLTYLDAWLALVQSDAATATQLSEAYLKHPVERWRKRFTRLHQQASGALATTDPEREKSAEESNEEQAAKAPSLSFDVAGSEVSFRSRNIDDVRLKLFPMDLELQFSMNPFQSGEADKSDFRNVAPATRFVHKADQAFTIPANYQSRNLIFEAEADGIRRSQPVFAHQLAVDWVEPYGRLTVTHAEEGKVLPLTYVKVYVQETGGTVSFYRDGYTDLRGQFEYAASTSKGLSNVNRLAVLVLHDDFGGLVREVEPPKR